MSLFDIININKQALLEAVLEKFKEKNLQPKIGIELEFYLQHQAFPANLKQTSEFISSLKSELSHHNINLLAIEPEQGFGQVEIKTAPYLDIQQLCCDVNKIKEITSNLKSDLQANFASQPYQKDCGSSLQINFSLIKSGEYLFVKDGLEESKYISQSIGATLKFTKNMMFVFAPEPADYLRFDLEINRGLHKIGKYTAPVNIGWGYNNRTALIRIPATKKPEERRLEFRLASSSADIYLTNLFFLLAILEGIKKEEVLPEEIYGNAFDEKYDLETLPNYEQAQDYFLNNNPLLGEILFILSGKKFNQNSTNSS